MGTTGGQAEIFSEAPKAGIWGFATLKKPEAGNRSWAQNQEFENQEMSTNTKWAESHEAVRSSWPVWFTDGSAELLAESLKASIA